ncbi:MAG: hypothetical protein IKO41_21650 [Lachnospiraceae bacterium]|nr:hypothetical protein [Lachnospiraceae bacterium]
MAKRHTKRQKRIAELKDQIIVRPRMTPAKAKKFKMTSLFYKSMSSNPKMYVFVNDDMSLNLEQSDLEGVKLYKELMALEAEEKAGNKRSSE